MTIQQIIEKVVEDCPTKHDAIERLYAFGMIDIRAVKYLLIHKHFMELSAMYSIVQAITFTAEEFKISERAVYRVREYWKTRKESLLVDIEI